MYLHQVLSAATDFVKLEENVSQVTYVGASLLIEYTVGTLFDYVEYTVGTLFDYVEYTVETLFDYVEYTVGTLFNYVEYTVGTLFDYVEYTVGTRCLITLSTR